MGSKTNRPPGPPGKLIENIQSDWHQAGRKQGYEGINDVALKKQLATQRADIGNQLNNYAEILRKDIQPLSPAEIAEYRELRTQFEYTDLPFDVEMRMQDLHRRQNLSTAPAHIVVGEAARAGDEAAQRLMRAYEEMWQADAALGHKIPVAPFKETWPDLQMKQQVLDAADSPAEWIGITDANTLRSRGEEISDAFQEQRLPNTLRKILQPFGGEQMEQLPLQGNAAARAWIARLTPEMKERIRKEGLPLMTVAMMAVLGQQAGQQER